MSLFKSRISKDGGAQSVEFDVDDIALESIAVDKDEPAVGKVAVAVVQEAPREPVVKVGSPFGGVSAFKVDFDDGAEDVVPFYSDWSMQTRAAYVRQMIEKAVSSGVSASTFNELISKTGRINPGWAKERLPVEPKLLGAAQIRARGHEMLDVTQIRPVDVLATLINEGPKVIVGVGGDDEVVRAGAYEIDLSLGPLFSPITKFAANNTRIQCVAPIPQLQAVVESIDLPGYTVDKLIRDYAILFHVVSGKVSCYLAGAGYICGDGSKKEISAELHPALEACASTYVPSYSAPSAAFGEFLRHCVRRGVPPLLKVADKTKVFSMILESHFGTVEEPKIAVGPESMRSKHATPGSMLGAFRTMRSKTLLDSGLAKDVAAIFTTYKVGDKSEVGLNWSVARKALPALTLLMKEAPECIIYGGVTKGRGPNRQMMMFKNAAETAGIGFLAFDKVGGGVIRLDAMLPTNVTKFVKDLITDKGQKKFVVHLDLADDRLDADVSDSANMLAVTSAVNFINAGASMVTFKANLFAGMTAPYAVAWLKKSGMFVRGREHAGEGVAVMVPTGGHTVVNSVLALANLDISAKFGRMSAGQEAKAVEVRDAAIEVVKSMVSANLRRGLKRPIADGDVLPVAAPAEDYCVPVGAIGAQQIINLDTLDFDVGSE